MLNMWFAQCCKQQETYSPNIYNKFTGGQLLYVCRLKDKESNNFFQHQMSLIKNFAVMQCH